MERICQPGKGKHAVALLQIALERVSGHNIHLYIDCINVPIAPPHTLPLFALLRPTSHRWASLVVLGRIGTNHQGRIGLPVFPVAATPRHTPGFPSLELVEICFSGFPGERELLRALENSPKLSSVYISGLAQSPLDRRSLQSRPPPNFPWRNLVQLEVNPVEDEWSMDVLSRCTRLHTLVIRNPSTHIPITVQPIRLESVRRLQVSVLSTAAETSTLKHICYALTLPHLEDLEVIHSVGIFTGLDCIFDLVERSACQRSVNRLAIRGITMIDLTVVRLLRALPEIRRLSLNGELLFPHLFRALANDPGLLPKLGFLSISPSLVLDETLYALVDMAKARCSDSPDDSRLHTLRIEISGITDNPKRELAARLSTLRSEVFLVKIDEGVVSQGRQNIDTSFKYLFEKLVRIKSEWESKIIGPRAKANILENGYLLDYMLAVMEKTPAKFSSCFPAVKLLNGDPFWDTREGEQLNNSTRARKRMAGLIL
ncbi:hypothetical protein V5O48_009491 [Marasmius crinis-equi]|uniref:F-box domain-containing protein n=1 Tax=Marasmius crinis-equi TaxID=585013 RepID=A0ABR3FB35_9AGAR